MGSTSGNLWTTYNYYPKWPVATIHRSFGNKVYTYHISGMKVGQMFFLSFFRLKAATPTKEEANFQEFSMATIYVYREVEIL